MRAVYSFESGVRAGGEPAATTARQLAESLSTLPLPEDYALQVHLLHEQNFRLACCYPCPPASTLPLPED